MADCHVHLSRWRKWFRSCHSRRSSRRKKNKNPLCLVPVLLGRFLQGAKYGWDGQMLPAAALHLPPVKGPPGDSFWGTNTGLLLTPSLLPGEEASQQTTGVPLQSRQLVCQSPEPGWAGPGRVGSGLACWLLYVPLADVEKNSSCFSPGGNIKTQNCLICSSVNVR